MNTHYDHRSKLKWKLIVLVLVLPWLTGCAARGDISKPVPSAFYPAPQAADRMVVMLPGIGDSLQDLQNRHVASTIQKIWPHADVVLVGLTYPFYKQGHAAQRLENEVVSRYRKVGQPLWLVGISLGGMGALLYDRQYPGEAHGMLLMSPYLGEDDIHEKIRAAGGLTHWNPGPEQKIDAKNYPHELWHYLQNWRKLPMRTDTVWIAYGANEPFRKPIEMVTPMLPPGHAIMLSGHHDWKLWNQALPALLKRAK